VYSTSYDQHAELCAYLKSHAGFSLLDRVYLVSSRPFSTKKKWNGMPSSTAILTLVCRAAQKEKFIFRAVKGCTNNHKSVSQVLAKRFMKLEKVERYCNVRGRGREEG
jgi:hypothetical protein